MSKFRIRFDGDYSVDYTKFISYETQLKKFFGSGEFNIKLFILDSRDDYNKFVKMESTPKWEVGGHVGELKIVLLSPEAMERESTHKKEEFYQILAHESTHAI